MQSVIARRSLAVLVAGALSVWLALIVVVPGWRAEGESRSLRTTAWVVTTACGRVCHQRADRSFHSDGQPWPVCARCTGVYAGAVAGSWLALFGAWRSRRRPQGAERLRWPLVAAAAPTAISWGVEFAGRGGFSNGARFALALPLGAVAAWVVTSMAAGRVD